MVVAFTTTIIGLATGTLAYVVAVVRQGWVNETVREQRYLAERDCRRESRTGQEFRMARFLHLPSPEEPPEEDPLAGVANLFDVSVVFIVGLMITLFSVYRMSDLVDSKSEVTMVKTNAQGEQEIIVKKGTKITAYKVSGKTDGRQRRASGDGVPAGERADHLRAEKGGSG